MRSAASRLRIVLDTNVLVSAVAFSRRSPPAAMLEYVRAGKAEAFISPFILKELDRILQDKVRWERRRVDRLAEELSGFFSLVHPRQHANIATIPAADNRILDCAVEARADFLVTGDRRHLRPLNSFKGIDILTPAEFITRHATKF